MTIIMNLYAKKILNLNIIHSLIFLTTEQGMILILKISQKNILYIRKTLSCIGRYKYDNKRC